MRHFSPPLPPRRPRRAGCWMAITIAAAALNGVRWIGDLGRLWFLAHAAPGGMAGGEPGVATSGAVAGHGQLRELSPFVLQPGIHHPLDAENLAAASPTLSGRYAGSAISSYSLRPGAQSAAGRGAAPRAGSAAFSRAYLIFSSTHVN